MDPVSIHSNIAEGATRLASSNVETKASVKAFKEANQQPQQVMDLISDSGLGNNVDVAV